MKKEIRFYGFARFGREVRVFERVGPSPCTFHYDRVAAIFPDTTKGARAAADFCWANTPPS